MKTRSKPDASSPVFVLTWNQKKALRSAYHHLRQARVMLTRFAASVGMESTLADACKWERELGESIRLLDGNAPEDRRVDAEEESHTGGQPTLEVVAAGGQTLN